MRKEVPLLICFLSGLLMIVAFFSGNDSIQRMSTEFLNWSMIIGGAAFFLAVGSLFKVNLQRISRRSEGWAFSVILLASFFITIILGCWFGVDDKYADSVDISNPDLLANFQSGVDAYKAGKTTEGVGLLGSILNITDEAELERIVGEVDKGGIPTNQQIEVKRYNPFFFIYKYVYAPMAGTMFSLLAFFVASAAFRAFKARTKEATLLLTAAFLVMLGRVSIGQAIWPTFSDIAGWIMNVPQTAGQRAIQIGAALGLVSSSLRILLGLEQSYLGQD